MTRGAIAGISAVVTILVGVVGFSLTKDFVAGQDTTNWSTTDITMWQTGIPLGLSLVTFIAVFSGLGGFVGRGS